MERTLYLCFACAADMTQGYDLEELPGQLKNARCEKCARKAWGATYKITKRTAAHPTKAVPRLNKHNP